MQAGPMATQRRAAPTKSALRLGYAGLVPFAVGAALVWAVDRDARPFVATALVAYAALVASFLGGIHWGIGMAAMPSHAAASFAWGTVPCLVAWAAVVMRPEAGLVIAGVLIVVCYAVDRRIYPPYGLAPWLVLRFRLSAVAALCCFLGAAGA